MIDEIEIDMIDWTFITTIVVLAIGLVIATFI